MTDAAIGTIGSEKAESRTSTRLLEAAAVAFTVAVLLHNSDHVRRGADATPTDVFWLGTAAIVIEVGVVAMVFARHRLAPVAAAAAGFGLAVGYLAVHFTPERGFVSDSLIEEGAEGLSIAAASLETAAALALGLAGLHAMRHVPALAGGRLLHPAVVAMAAGNAAILIASFAGR